MGMSIICAGLFPALQRTLSLDTLRIGAVNRIRQVTETVGGKAVNTARVLNTLKAEPLLLGFAGGDNRPTVERLLAGEGITYRFVPTEAPVRLAQTIRTNDAQDFTELVEEGPFLTPVDAERFLALFSELLEAGISGTVISGTLPDHAPVDLYDRMVRLIPPSVPVVLDTSGPALLAAVSSRPCIVKINASELFLTIGQKDTQPHGNAIQEAALTLIRQGALAVGVTQGGRDAWLVSDRSTLRFRLPEVTPVSALGCGDAVNAGLIDALQHQSEIPDAFVSGLACGIANALTPLPGLLDTEQVKPLAAAISVEPHP